MDPVNPDEELNGEMIPILPSTVYLFCEKRSVVEKTKTIRKYFMLTILVPFNLSWITTFQNKDFSYSKSVSFGEKLKCKSF
jgi:hypothetical protein